MTAFLALRSAPSGVPFVGVNQDDTVLWDVAAKAWYVGPGGGAALVTSVFGRIGDVVAQTGDYDSDQVDNVSGVPGASVSDALDNLLGVIAALTSDDVANASGVAGATVSDALDTLAAGQAPNAANTRRTLYVDPTVVAYPPILTPGTILTPYNTIQAAINATTPGAPWLIIVPPGRAIGENLTIPAVAGTEIEIRCEGARAGILNGTITWNAAGGVLTLTNMYVDDVIGGAATAESTVRIQSCFLNQTIQFTGSLVHLYFAGPFPPIGSSVALNFARMNGHVFTTGDVFASGELFSGLTFNARNAYLSNCQLGALGTNLTFNLTGNRLRLLDTQNDFIDAINFSAPGGVVQLDGTSSSSYQTADPTLTNGTTDRLNCPQGGVYAWFAGLYNNGTQGAGYTVNFENGQKQQITLNASGALDLEFPPGAGDYRLVVIQGGAGSIVPDLARSPSGAVRAPGGALTFSTAVGARDILNIFNDGTDCYVSLVPDFQVI